MLINPLMPWAIRSNPPWPLYGPVPPNPEIEQYTRLGLRADSSEKLRPSLSMTPGRKFSTTTSARSTNLLKTD